MLSYLAAGHEITKTVCDTKSEIIRCDSGSTITVQHAFYGRVSWSICSHGKYFNIKPCSAPGILEKMAVQCNMKTECTLKAPPDGVSDPCPAFTKYLTVTYTCDSK